MGVKNGTGKGFHSRGIAPLLHPHPLSGTGARRAPVSILFWGGVYATYQVLAVFSLMYELNSVHLGEDVSPGAGRSAARWPARCGW